MATKTLIKMDKKRIKAYVLLSVGIVCLIIVALYLLGLRRDYYHELPMWNAEAEKNFEKALIFEVKKRGEVPTWIMSVNSTEGIQLLKDSFPGFVVLDSECGKRTFQIPKEKYEHNLVKESSKSLLLSILLEDYPISVDTLKLHWDSLLLEKHILADTYIRYAVTDLSEHTTTTYSKNRGANIQADSLLSRYLGARCEVEATGFISYNFWGTIGWRQWVLLFFPLIAFVVLVFSYERLLAYVGDRFRRQGNIIGENVRVHHANMEKTTIYDLGDGALFDSSQGFLLKDGMMVGKMTPQVCVLLKAFLNAEKNSLTAKQICHEVWNDADGSEKLYMLISRLRKAVKVVSLDVIFDGKGTYMLRKVGTKGMDVKLAFERK